MAHATRFTGVTAGGGGGRTSLSALGPVKRGRAARHRAVGVDLAVLAVVADRHLLERQVAARARLAAVELKRRGERVRIKFNEI